VYVTLKRKCDTVVCRVRCIPSYWNYAGYRYLWNCQCLRLHSL